VRAVVITGAPGAGKTSVLTALMGLLEADDVRYAAVEVESLSLVHPWPDDDAAFDHLAYVAASFRRRGYGLLLVSATIENREYLRRLVDALASDEVKLVRLEAPSALLRERIARREPPEWVGLPRLLEAAGTIATNIAALPGVDVVLSTEAAEPRDVAAAVRDALHLR
jgi:adenylate kinase family enzyme